MIFDRQIPDMPTVVREPGSRLHPASRSGDVPVGVDPLEDLLRSSGALTPAPAPVPHRALALDALRLRRGLRDPRRRPAGWGNASFAREVELIRCHLAPLRDRRGLSASFSREAFQTLELDPARSRALGPIRAAYAIRWLELGGGGNLPAWTRLLAADAG
ncbi:MAG TPA: hypothetical protein VFW02_08680 [Candidatus Limnocylindrales bacterium]|nr:hypothetical protein [Candidatus Limnocylindrales bacterium]